MLSPPLHTSLWNPDHTLRSAACATGAGQMRPPPTPAVKPCWDPAAVQGRGGAGGCETTRLWEPLRWENTLPPSPCREGLSPGCSTRRPQGLCVWVIARAAPGVQGSDTGRSRHPTAPRGQCPRVKHQHRDTLRTCESATSATQPASGRAALSPARSPQPADTAHTPAPTSRSPSPEEDRATVPSP